MCDWKERMTVVLSNNILNIQYQAGYNGTQIPIICFGRKEKCERGGLSNLTFRS